MRHSSLVFVALAALVGCAPTSSESVDSSEARLTASFGACAPGYPAECAFLDVPLDHARPDGETIKLHIARQRAPSGKATKQLWLLAGGPGQSDDVFTPFLRG